MFFPFSTDAPVYYWPYGTVGLIVVNVLAFAGVMTGALPQDPDLWLLTYGQLSPVQWLLSAFMHQDIFHLVGNMIFLWVFGLIVEGKLGVGRYLACYLGIAVLESAVEQVLFLGYSGSTSGSLGASTAIYGIMAMAAVWAPRNDITCFYWFGIIWAGTVDVPVAVLCLIYMALDGVGILLGSATGWLHYAGAVLGFPLALVLLKLKVVDCEGWDLLHVWRGDPGGRIAQEQHDAQQMAERRERQAQRLNQVQTQARQQLHVYLKSGNGLAALKLLDKLQENEQPLELTEQEILALVPLLHQAGKFRESAPLMARLIELRGDRTADPVRLKLAQICVVELGKPARALELVRAVDTAILDGQRRTLAAKIEAKATAMQADAELELEEEAW